MLVTNIPFTMILWDDSIHRFYQLSAYKETWFMVYHYIKFTDGKLSLKHLLSRSNEVLNLRGSNVDSTQTICIV